MDFPMNSKTPHFNYDEVVEIYRRTDHPTERKLRDTARNLFPGRDPITYENLFLSSGPWRAFMHNGDYEKPQLVLMSYPTQIGIMKDGTTYPF